MATCKSTQADELVAAIRNYESCVVAYSGGVDSAVVAMAAKLALGDHAVAATGIGPAVAASEIETARRVAGQIGIEHVELETREIDLADYVANAADRCFHCKTELYGVLGRFAQERGLSAICNGTNFDDLGDYRPGLEAAANASVRSPLVECKLDKSAIRALAEYWELEVAEKPASPCLASRIAYGQSVTTDRLKMVEAGERLLHELGIAECRVRLHEGEVARLEVPLAALESLVEPAVREWLVAELTAIGFRHVAIDLAGFRSGSLNVGLPVLR